MRVAITGGIAEGKSTVMAIVAELGHATASSDAIARRVFSEPEVQARLAAAAGLDAPAIAPAELRAAITASDAVRKRVNAIMHPRVRAAMDDSPARFHEVPLLIEACLYGRYDRIWVVTCGAEEQRRRLIARLGDPATADALIASQLPTAAKEAFADEIIRSDQSLDAMRAHVELLVSRVRAASVAAE
jgi:dephospho-CoA kinase